MRRCLELGDVEVDVVFKDIKNLHLSVHPPSGRVTVSAPQQMELSTVRAFAASKIGWIRRQRNTIKSQERLAPPLYIDRESHYLWGRRYLLEIETLEGPTSVSCEHTRLVLRLPNDTNESVRERAFAQWRREQVREAAEEIIDRWEPIVQMRPERLIVRQMKTRWGSCTPASRIIRLNTELSKKPPECLEYIVVHELTHLHERTHNDRFVKLLTKWLPDWRTRRDQLNALPVRHEEWTY